MTHPLNLHAAAALASLRDDLPALHHRVDRERYGWAHVTDGIRSWQPGSGSNGGYSDPVARAVAGSVRTRAAQRAQWTTDTLTWLADRLGLMGEPMGALHAAVRALRPSTARELTRWLRELDQAVRDDAGLHSDGLRPVLGECGACQVRLIHRTPGGMLVCRNEACRCAGEHCACGMPIRAAGIAHIWETV